MTCILEFIHSRIAPLLPTFIQSLVISCIVLSGTVLTSAGLIWKTKHETFDQLHKCVEAEHTEKAYFAIRCIQPVCVSYTQKKRAFFIEMTKSIS